MLNIEELRIAIRKMTRRQEIYRVLKEELTEKGYWKNKSRGMPFTGYEKSQFGRQPRKDKFNHNFYKTASERALARANRRCEICGSKDNLIVHHMKPINGESRYYSQSNNPDHLRILCRSCHSKIHAHELQGSVDIER